MQMNTVQLQFTEIPPPQISVIQAFDLKHSVFLNVNYTMHENKFYAKLI